MSSARQSEIDQSVPAVFARIAAQHSQSIAVKTNGTEWTYAELDQRSDALAASVLDRVEDDSKPIALLMEHGPHLISAILAALKAGKIYVVLDPKVQRERLSATLLDSTAYCLMADKPNLDLAGALGIPVLPVSQGCFSASTPITLPKVEGNNGAWIMYTSGSTGVGKGVFQNHRGIVHDADVYGEIIEVGEGDRLALVMSCSHSASGTSLFTALLKGATVCPFDVRRHGPEALVRWLGEYRITAYHSVPTVFRHLVGAAQDETVFGSLRWVRLGGEPVLSRDLELFRTHVSEECRLIHSLGSTETGQICAAVFDRNSVVGGGKLPVGRPFRDVEIFLVDEGNQPAKSGVSGRIVVRGKYLRQGYWRRPEETARKFQPDPVDPEMRTFVTEDRARLFPDGSLEHLGRADRVVKIGGLRADLEELEQKLCDNDLVLNAAVTASKDSIGADRLVAYVVPRHGPPRSSMPLTQKLRRSFPVPCRFIAVNELPMLANGKIDRVLLTRQAAQIIPERSKTSDVQTAINHELVSIWEKVLRVRPIGLTDDFFALGADSLAAVIMLTAVEKSFGINLPAAALAEVSTVESLGALIGKGGEKHCQSTIVPLRRQGDRLPLFCVPSAGSSAFEFFLLKGHLAENQPVFAFQSPGLDGRTRCAPSVEELADYFIVSMRKEQGRGPYQLCGTSFGGLVAFEMAKRLVACGEQVRFLGLLDCYGGDYPKARKDLPVRKWMKLALLRFLPQGQRTLFTLAEFRKGMKERTKRWLIRKLIWLDSLLNTRLRACPPSWRPLYVQEVCFAASRRYQPGRFSGKIDLFQAEHQPPSDLFESDPFLGWTGVAEIRVHQVPGHHNMYLRDSKIVAELARQMDASLGQG